MSIDYEAIPKREEDYREVLAEALYEDHTQNLIAIDRDKIAARIEGEISGMTRFEPNFEQLAELEEISVEEARRKYRWIELSWDEARVQVTVHDHSVGVSLSGGSRPSLRTLAKVFRILEDEGLYIWDEMSGEFLEARSIQIPPEPDPEHH